MRRDTALLTLAMAPAAAVLVLLLALSIVRLGASAEGLGRSRSATPLPAPIGAAEQTRALFSWPSTFAWEPLTNSRNPFYTLAIRPPPVSTPPPPAPATRRVDITYRGFFQTSAGVRRAVIQVDDKQILSFPGNEVVAGYAVAAIDYRQLVLTNAAGARAEFAFSRTAPLEIPTNP